MHSISRIAIIAALSLAVCQSAMAQDDPTLGLVDVQATDFSRLGDIVHPPRARLSLEVVPDRPEGARDITSREACIEQNGKWSYVPDNEHGFRVGCLIDQKVEGLWFYTAQELKLTREQQRKKVSFDEAFDLSSLPRDGYVWYVNKKREGWEIHYSRELGFVTTIISWHAGRKNGLEMKWDKHGKLDQSVHYVNGERDGAYEEYDDGRPFKFGHYTQGKPDGIWEWYRGGKLALRVDYGKSILFGEIRPIIATKTRVPDLYKNIPDSKELFWMEDYGNNGRKYKTGYAMEGEGGMMSFYGDTQYYMSTGEPWFTISMYDGKIDDVYLQELCPRPSFGGFSTDNDKRLTCKDSNQLEYRVLQYYENGGINSIIEYTKDKVRDGIVKEYRSDGGIMADYRMEKGFPVRGDLSYRGADGAIFEPRSDIDFDLKKGVLRTFWENGNLRTETEYENGVRNGFYREYFSNGTKHLEVQYRDDVRHGELKSWFENGVLSYVIHYQNGKRHGRMEYHYTMGTLSNVLEYREDSPVGTEFEYYPNGGIKTKLVHDESNPKKLHVEEYGDDNRMTASGSAFGGEIGHFGKTGIWKYYLADGSVWFTQNFDEIDPDVQWCEERNGNYVIDSQNRAVGCSEDYPNRKVHQAPKKVRSGKWRWYTAQGHLEKEGSFRLGQLDGEWKYYYPNAQIMLKGEYALGIKTGNWVSYYENGVSRFEGNYKDGSEDGEWKTYYPKSGKLSSRGNFLAGIREGEWAWYYENGQIETNGTFRDNQETGAWTTYYDTGEKQGEGDFVAGNREGTWTWWRSDGRIWRTAEFVEGREKSPTGRDTKDVPQTALLQRVTKPNK